MREGEAGRRRERSVAEKKRNTIPAKMATGIARARPGYITQSSLCDSIWWGGSGPCLRGLRPLRHGITIKPGLRSSAPLGPPGLARVTHSEIHGYVPLRYPPGLARCTLPFTPSLRFFSASLPVSPSRDCAHAHGFPLSHTCKKAPRAYA